VPTASDPPLRVLLTNRVLAHRTGTELYIRDTAVALLRRGHLPVVYSPLLGALAAELRRETVPVVDDLPLVAERPDIIHGHHGLETLTALLAFPGVPAVTVCHSWVGWQDEPVRFPRIHRYLAVDDTCRHRLVSEHGIPPERVDVLLNAVDLARFRPRQALPARPARALVFSNSSGEGAPHVKAIRDACGRAGISLDLAGSKSGATLDCPEETLASYDLVFAKARAALEAAAIGTAVVLSDVGGSGPMITTSNVDALRRLNFGMRALRDAPSVETIAREIARYDADDAAAVSRQVRAVAAQDVLVDQLIAMYRDAIAAAQAAAPDLESEERAAAAYLRHLSPKLHERDLLRNAFRHLHRLPLAGAWMRRRARRESPTHWFQELLRSIERE
jgi:glycosyltransferase involved in cell wall biosynthesis